MAVISERGTTHKQTLNPHDPHSWPTVSRDTKTSLTFNVPDNSAIRWLKINTHNKTVSRFQCVFRFFSFFFVLWFCGCSPDMNWKWMTATQSSSRAATLRHGVRIGGARHAAVGPTQTRRMETWYRGVVLMSPNVSCTSETLKPFKRGGANVARLCSGSGADVVCA